ncbi:MAG: condensation domain-containing protein, partial [Pseudonocardiaceae bacterium]
NQTIAELAPVVTMLDTAPADREPVVGSFPLTPIQHWYFGTDPVNPNHFNQSMLMELVEQVDERALEQALAALLVHHDALRTRFEQVGGRWQATVTPIEDLRMLRRHHLPGPTGEDRVAAMSAAADAAHASLDLARPPLLRALLFTGARGQRPYLFLAAHHTAVDGVSWRLLLDDLDTAYHQALRGERCDLGAKTTSFRDWAIRLSEYVAEGNLDHELDQWASASHAGALPVDPPPDEPALTEQTVSLVVNAQDTEALLRSAPNVYRTRINDVLLAALAWSLCRWTGQNRVAIDLEGHGREELIDGVDLSRTVGWFTTMFPISLTVSGSAGEQDLSWRDLVRSVRRQLRAIPNNGFGFGALRYLGSPAIRERVAAAGSGAQISFNYLGQFEGQSPGPERGLYHAMHTAIGQPHDPADRDEHLLQVVGAVQDGQLRFSWLYQPDHHLETTVQRVADDFAEALHCIAQDCRVNR